MASMVEKKQFSKYLVEAKSWESEKVRSLEVSRRTAWIVAIVASLLAAISIVTVALLTPIQKVEAYVVRVDSGTGLVNVVRPLKDGDTNYDEAINKYFTQSYVRWREGYFQERAQEFYYNVGIMSSSQEQSRFLKIYDPANSGSPLNIYRNSGRSIITIKNTFFDGPGAARIQFTKEEDFAGKNHKTSQWTALVYYRYTGAPMSDKDREINPLGFQVINYTVSEDKPPQVAATASSTTPPPAGVTVPAIAPVAVPQVVAPSTATGATPAISTAASSPASPAPAPGQGAVPSPVPEGVTVSRKIAPPATTTGSSAAARTAQ